jgi:cysteine desulfurase
MIYLDYNATAPMRPEVIEAIIPACAMPLNASSVHALGRKAKRLLEDAREVLAEEFSCFANEVIFTGSGTEANNMALRGFPDLPLLVSAVEHSSVRETANRLGGDILRVDQNGLLDLDQLESKLKALGAPALVSVMAANNETGVKQPVRQIADIVHRYSGLFHVDAVQMVGKCKLDLGQIGADMMTISAHKMGGPIGIGALLLRNDLPIRPLIYGGNQELGRRAGTESIKGVLGFAKALEVAQKDDWSKRMELSMANLRARLKQHMPSAVIASEGAPRMPHVLNIMTQGLTSETQLMHLDLAGICVSAGSACSSGRIAPSHVLKAMGYSDAMAGSAIRISAGWNTTQEELEQFADVWLEMVQKLVRKAA